MSMTIDECITILKNEKKCVTLSALCDRHCENCNLVMDPDQIIEAYNCAIHILNNIDKNKKVML